MKACIDCLECVLHQATRAARIATDDETQQRAIIDHVAAKIPGFSLEQSPSELSWNVYKAAADVSGKEDPYRELKRRQNEMALAIEADMRRLIDDSDAPLHTALHLAAAGNLIDLGTRPVDSLHVEAVREAVMRAVAERFSVDHTEDLLRSLENCQDLLYLLDNAGEIVFDKLLIEQLLQHTPVTAVVKGGPIINDVLREDAEQVGLTKLCEIIDNGGPFIGSPLSQVPQRFLDRMHAADVIIGKGQGNYETIDAFDGDVFLILKAKCQVVAAHMGIAYEQLGLISTRRRARELAGEDAAALRA